jgi:hypothetical protein
VISYLLNISSRKRLRQVRLSRFLTTTKTRRESRLLKMEDQRLRFVFEVKGTY